MKIERLELLWAGGLAVLAVAIVAFIAFAIYQTALFESTHTCVKSHVETVYVYQCYGRDGKGNCTVGMYVPDQQTVCDVWEANGK